METPDYVPATDIFEQRIALIQYDYSSYDMPPERKTLEDEINTAIILAVKRVHAIVTTSKRVKEDGTEVPYEYDGGQLTAFIDAMDGARLCAMRSISLKHTKKRKSVETKNK